MGLSDDDVREILRIVDESELDELSIETEGFSLHVRKGQGAADIPSEAWPRRHASEGTSAPPESVEPIASSDGMETVRSPMLGTFYRAEAPGEAPFVEIGARVGPDTTICIIEVMKMMNSVPAGVSGVIAEIVPENGQLVEYGEPLFRVKPGP